MSSITKPTRGVQHAIAAILRKWVAADGRRWNALARASGRAHQHWIRKLDTEASEPRKLDLRDVDELLTVLGKSPEDLLRAARLWLADHRAEVKTNDS